MSRRECHNDWCSVQHLSNFSLLTQYGEEMPPTPCICECHLDEKNIHGDASRNAHDKPEICNKCKKQIKLEELTKSRLYKYMCNECGINTLLKGGSIKAEEMFF